MVILSELHRIGLPFLSSCAHLHTHDHTPTQQNVIRSWKKDICEEKSSMKIQSKSDELPRKFEMIP